MLGKRVDTASPERQPAPIKPLVPTEAIQAVRSDSRLDPRANSTSYGDIARASGGYMPSAPFPSDSADVRTQFTGVARFLSELVNGQTRSSPVIRSPLPLIPKAEQGAEKLASNLQRSVDYSGLFYESHLLRSYQGKWDWAKLQSEPQMNRQAETSPGLADLYKDEPMRGLIRQQLELLSVPQLRWEGEAWSGLHLEISLQYHQFAEDVFNERSDDERADDANREDIEAWQADLTFALPQLGNLGVHLVLQGDKVKVIATPASEQAEDMLFSGLARLRGQIEALGFREVQVIVGNIDEG
ncbi:flagellar hook-length control protein FliK [Microbulbifer aggregans]|uniref:flagellar hook-length control protein FliK n=1 Tax=Microbulbifer aggregans TaxID=1769779 RepID=UPI001CFE0302|nr:flagellar hook-length control protein FliK [Microbulbifer aggregans]